MPEETIKPSTAILYFTLASGVAAGLAQLVLNKRIKEATAVDYSSVLFAAGISAVATFLATYLVQTAIAEKVVKLSY